MVLIFFLVCMYLFFFCNEKSNNLFGYKNLDDKMYIFIYLDFKMYNILNIILYK